jgi:hypothetical protein
MGYSQQEELNMDREKAKAIARHWAAIYPQSYVGHPATFEPHEWVINAIMDAAFNHHAMPPVPPHPPSPEAQTS